MSSFKFNSRKTKMEPLFMSDPQGPLPQPSSTAEIGPMGPPSATMTPESAGATTTVEPEEKKEKLEEIERLRSQEVFTKRATGDYECQGCGWKYREASGVGKIKAGTPFTELGPDFVCPVCKAPKPAFVELTELVSGFEVNKQYGLFNEMTESNKNLLIFGGLGFFFVLFLCGYLLE